MPYRNPTNKMLILITYSGVLFWLFPMFLNGDMLQMIVNSLLLMIATIVLVTWGSSAYYALRGNVTAVHQHIIATVFVWLIVWVQRIYAIIFVVMDRPHWLSISAFPAFIAYMFGVTGIFVVVAPALLDGANQKEYVKQIAVGTILGMILAIVSFVIQIRL